MTSTRSHHLTLCRHLNVVQVQHALLDLFVRPGATVVLFELFTADTHFASKVVADTVFWGFRVVRFHSCDLNILSGVSTHQKQSERDSGTGVFSVRASLIADVNE
jgi:hypothetical protein